MALPLGVIDLAGHLLDSGNHLAHGLAVARAQVDGQALAFVLQVMQGLYVGLGQVGHVNIIAHAGAVPGVVIGAENLDMPAAALGGVHHQRDQSSTAWAVFCTEVVG